MIFSKSLISKYLSHRKTLIFFIALGAVLRFLYLIEVQDIPVAFHTSYLKAFDQYNFVTGAQDILAHPWLGSKPTDWTATYSYFIAILFRFFSENLNGIFFTQILLGVLAIYIFYKAASLLFDNEKIGLIAAAMAALYAPFFYYECAILRASLIVFCNVTSFYFLVKAVRKEQARDLFWGGLFLGLSMILRENILPYFLCIYLLWVIKAPWMKRFIFVGFFLLGLAIPILSLSLRNKALGQDALISQTGQTIFWIGNSYNSPGIGYVPSGIHEELGQESEGRLLKTFQIWLRELRQHPQEYKSLYARKFKMVFNGYEIPANLSYDLFKENSWVLQLTPFNFVVISPLALLGFFLGLKHLRKFGLLYIFFIGTVFFVFAFHVQSRYRLPSVPFFIFFAAFAIYQVGMFIKDRKIKFLMPSLLVLWFFVFFTQPDVELIHRYFGAPIRYMDYNNYAVTCLMEYQSQYPRLSTTQRVRFLNQAEKYFQKVLNLCPMNWKGDIHFYLGTILYEKKEYAPALDSLKDALLYEPSFSDAKSFMQLVENFKKAEELGYPLIHLRYHWKF